MQQMIATLKKDIRNGFFGLSFKDSFILAGTPRTMRTFYYTNKTVYKFYIRARKNSRRFPGNGRKKTSGNENDIPHGKANVF